MPNFHPSSSNFLKIRAKLLHKAYPHLNLTACLESTAKALGFRDWYNAKKQIDSNESPSTVDEYSINRTVAERRYTQGRVLIDHLNIAPAEADHFVRRWNLTSAKKPTINDYSTSFDEVYLDYSILQNDSTPDEKKNIREKYFGRKLKIITDGLIVEEGGEKSIYHVSSQKLITLKHYIKGNASAFSGEDAHLIKIGFPNFFTKEEVKNSMNFVKLNEPMIYQLMTGETVDEIDLMKLKEDAERKPNDWFALSFRFDDNKIDKPLFYYPSLKGSDFVKFVEAEGDLKGLDLRWFTPNNPRKPHNGIIGIRLQSEDFKPAIPIYLSPFKKGPFRVVEYNIDAEVMWWPIDQNVDEDDFELADEFEPLEFDMDKIMQSEKKNSAAIERAIRNEIESRKSK